MGDKLADHAGRLMRSGRASLTDRERDIIDRITRRAAISRELDPGAGGLTFGQRVADKVAAFGGSWTFIFIFGGLILAWVILNAVILSGPPDPYPFILLNLILSMVAAIQAPVIMMSQNRMSANDRLTMNHDYEVNLKAELEIMALHDKVDDIRQRQLAEHFARIEARLDGIEAKLAASPHSPPG
jgi:uncharacterized membrane protein